MKERVEVCPKVSQVVKLRRDTRGRDGPDLFFFFLVDRFCYLDLLLRRPLLESEAELARRRRMTSAAAAFDMAGRVWMGKRKSGRVGEWKRAGEVVGEEGGAEEINSQRLRE